MKPYVTRRNPAAPTVLLVKMTAGTVAVLQELEGHYRVVSARHIQAACRLLEEARPAVVIASASLPFHDVYVLRTHLPPGAALRLEDPALPPRAVARTVRSAQHLPATPRTA